MRIVRAAVLGVGVVLGSAVMASAQAVVPVQWWGWGHRDNDDRQAFNEGYRQGQYDARSGRRFDPDNNRWREADDRRAFCNGYRRGYEEFRGSYGRRDNDHDRDDGYYGGDRRGPWNGGYNNGYGQSAAQRVGYQDGLNDGSNDRRTGHSYRPTQDGNYRHADRGYIPGYGDKNYYRQAYRQAYEQGYQQGYNGGGWRR